jgi:ADP-ribose pyrophosphatase YjhB (NUDIX family)
MNSSRLYDHTTTTPSKISDSPNTSTSQSSTSPESSGGEVIDANQYTGSNTRFSVFSTNEYTKFLPEGKSCQPLETNEITTDAAALVEWRATTCFPMNLDLVQALHNHSIARMSKQKNQTSKNENRCDECTIEELQQISRDARGRLMELTVSREGRELQRWDHLGVTNSNNSNDGNCINYNDQPNCRLTTGCIPILPGGRILLISSTKSSNIFVLPKGGWEHDESLPLSALRETFEEAGVTGLLGPPLPPLTYETKKSVSRRLLLGGTPTKFISTSTTTHGTSGRPISSSDSPISAYHTHNRLIIFPMYVQCIYDDWPERNRLRRIVTTDEASVLLQHRPEFLHMIQELRDRKLHVIGVN